MYGCATTAIKNVHEKWKMGLAYLLAHMIASIWIANVRNAIEN